MKKISVLVAEKTPVNKYAGATRTVCQWVVSAVRKQKSQREC